MGIEAEPVIVGVFDAPDEARAAIRDLRDARISDKSIGLLTRGADGDPHVTAFKELEGNEAPKGAAIGVAAGAGSGALWALGVAAGFLPAIGPVIAGGLLAAVAASAAAGAGAGAVLGTLVGLGITDEEAAYYDEELRKGGTIVVVKPEGRADLVHTILRAHRSEIRDVLPTESVGQRIATELRH